jgi:hypothetical protein
VLRRILDQGRSDGSCIQGRTRLPV